MKKTTFLFLFVFLIKAFAFSQETTFHDSTIVYAYQGADSSYYFKILSTSDQKDRLYYLANYLWDTTTDSWRAYDKYEYDYDLNGQTILNAHYQWDTVENRWIGIKKQEHAFDLDTNELLSAYYVWDTVGNEWRCSVRKEYAYNEKGDITTAVEKRWNPDSHTCENYSKDVYEYDSDGNLASSIRFSWDPDHQVWANKYATKHSYDSNGHRILSESYKWDPDNNKWVEFFKTERTYDTQGYNTLTISYMWSVSKDQWIFYEKTVYDYDKNGNLISTARYKWDKGSNEWEGDFKEEVSYDDNDKRILEIEYTWNSKFNIWINSNKIENAWDAGGHMVMTADYSWDSEAGEWIGKRKYEYGYQNDLKTFYMMYVWVPEKKNWGYDIREEYTYDAEGHKTSALHKEWDPNSGEWVDRWMKEYFFNPKGRKTVKKEYLQDTAADSLILYYTWFYHYGGYYFPESDSVCEGDSLLWQGQYRKEAGLHTEKYLSVTGRDSIYTLTLAYYPEPASFIITGSPSVEEYQILTYSVPADTAISYFWTVQNGNILSNPAGNAAQIQWGSAGEGTVYAVAENAYGCKSDTAELEITITTATGVDEIQNAGVKVYPNPVSDKIIVESNEDLLRYRLMDMNGKTLREGEICQNGQIDVSCLAPGVYFLKIQGKKTFRILKR